MNIQLINKTTLIANANLINIKANNHNNTTITEGHIQQQHDAAKELLAHVNLQIKTYDEKITLYFNRALTVINDETERSRLNALMKDNKLIKLDAIKNLDGTLSQKLSAALLSLKSAYTMKSNIIADINNHESIDVLKKHDTNNILAGIDPTAEYRAKKDALSKIIVKKIKEMEDKQTTADNIRKETDAKIQEQDDKYTKEIARLNSNSQQLAKESEALKEKLSNATKVGVVTIGGAIAYQGLSGKDDSGDTEYRDEYSNDTAVIEQANEEQILVQ